MTKKRPGLTIVVAIMIIQLIGTGAAGAAAAIAVGRCGAGEARFNGYHDAVRNKREAQRRALHKCATSVKGGDRHCQVKSTTRRECTAVALDMVPVCGPRTRPRIRGLAHERTLENAEATAWLQCRQQGGNNCVIHSVCP